ncbi:hypothetical protein F2Q68_00044521 [Brassica cretica]|uniref:ABC transporter domain-containing protein n=1 Tax=Brassica cretica TaxID=69181 RepID=A0A8S9LHG5_BRACR|nr:hypothetical protein F2Q68_00044521 [Brassica cretica]
MLIWSCLHGRWVGIELPTVEVRFRDLSVEAECEVVHGKPIPTLWNTVKGILSEFICSKKETKISILKGLSGIVRPGSVSFLVFITEFKRWIGLSLRMTLLLGPPGCGKTTLLQALSGRLAPSVKVGGEVSYNGCLLSEFIPEKTSSYISQNDLHIPEMSVRETLDFSACCLGIGSRMEIMKEISRREKVREIVPDPDIDAYMKIHELEMPRGLEYLVAKRGGELVVGPATTLFMDEISNGLDSSTTFQIVSCLQQLAHIAGATILVSLLQPAPETFELFDDVILMGEGKIIYHAPRADICRFFEDFGFKCPERKGVADFLQEVMSKKDQEQYWCLRDKPYSYISVDSFIDKFQESNLGVLVKEELSKPFQKSQSRKDGLCFRKYSLGKWEMLKACSRREYLLMKRNSFIYLFKSGLLVFNALVTMTVFLQAGATTDARHGNYLMGSLFTALFRLLADGLPELTLTLSRMGVFCKQKDLYFYPAWAYAIPSIVLKIPLSVFDSFLWTLLTYYAIGYSPEVGRFFRQFLILFTFNISCVSMFRAIAAIFRTFVASSIIGAISVLVLSSFGGFVIPKSSMPAWLEWGFWISPLSYAEIGLTANEFNAPRWRKLISSNTTAGEQVLDVRGLNFGRDSYWIGFGALIGFIFFFNVLYALALTYRNNPQRSRAIVSHGKNIQPSEEDFKPCPESTSRAKTDTRVGDASRPGISGGQKRRLTTGELVVGPATTLFMDEISNGLDSSTTFQIVSCLQQLAHIAGATILVSLLQPAPETFELFDDVILMGEGKIIYHAPRADICRFFEDFGFKCPERKGVADFLQEVMSKKDQEQYWCLRDKPYSYISVDSFIDKFQESNLGVLVKEELSKPFQKSQSRKDGLCFRKYSLGKWEMLKACSRREYLLMKRNSFIYLFKSGLLVFNALVTMTVFLQAGATTDARHGNYLMGSLFTALFRLLADGLPELTLTLSRMGVFCKQKDLYFYPAWAYAIPSIVLKIPLSVFDSFLWTLLTYYAIGYSPEVGRFFRQFLILFTFNISCVSMFRAIAAIFRTFVASSIIGAIFVLFLSSFGGFVIPKSSMPAWLEWGFWISPLSYAEMGLTANEFYASRWRKLISGNTTAGEQVLDVRGLNFGRDSYWIGFGALIGFIFFFNVLYALALTYRNNPQRSRAIVSHGKNIQPSEEDFKPCPESTSRAKTDLFSIFGSMYTLVIFSGINNCATVMNFIATERNIFYRERFARMYSSWAYSFSQVLVEIPYSLLQSLLCTIIVYPMIGYHMSVYKMFWSWYSTFCSLLIFNYCGMLMVALTPNIHMALTLRTTFFSMVNLFAGFTIPKQKIPKWWIWMYYLSPTSWVLEGLLNSQYGDVDKQIIAFGETKRVSAFLEDYFGYRYDSLALVAFVLIAFPIVVASLFAFFMSKLNFQKK